MKPTASINCNTNNNSNMNYIITTLLDRGIFSRMLLSICLFLFIYSFVSLIKGANVVYNVNALCI